MKPRAGNLNRIMEKNLNLSYDEVNARLRDWLINFVEVEHPSLGGWAPCPYARQARLNNKIFVVIDDPTLIANYLDKLDDHDVVIVCFDPVEYSAEQITKFVENINNILADRDTIILEDHPDLVEHINGVPMNFGYCGLLIMQRASKLKTASEQLQRAGYYSVWSEQELAEVVNWR